MGKNSILHKHKIRLFFSLSLFLIKLETELHRISQQINFYALSNQKDDFFFVVREEGGKCSKRKVSFLTFESFWVNKNFTQFCYTNSVILGVSWFFAAPMALVKASAPAGRISINNNSCFFDCKEFLIRKPIFFFFFSRPIWPKSLQKDFTSKVTFFSFAFKDKSVTFYYFKCSKLKICLNYLNCGSAIMKY